MIGKMLREYRNKIGLSQESLAKALHVHPKSIKNWEADISDPNLENLCAMSDLFGVSIDSIAGHCHDSEQIEIGPLNADDRRKLLAVIQAFVDACAATR